MLPVFDLETKTCKKGWIKFFITRSGSAGDLRCFQLKMHGDYLYDAT